MSRLTKNLRIPNPHFFYLALGRIRDPEKLIPDPRSGVKIAPDPGSGSATMA
jgi:hypothetical protein